MLGERRVCVVCGARRVMWRAWCVAHRVSVAQTGSECEAGAAVEDGRGAAGALIAALPTEAARAECASAEPAAAWAVAVGAWSTCVSSGAVRVRCGVRRCAWRGRERRVGDRRRGRCGAEGCGEPWISAWRAQWDAWRASSVCGMWSGSRNVARVVCCGVWCGGCVAVCGAVRVRTCAWRSRERRVSDRRRGWCGAGGLRRTLEQR